MIDTIKKDEVQSSVVLEARGVCRSFDKPSGAPLVVLENVDLTLHKGEIVGLLGRSGSGKSTLLRIVAGLIKPSRGEVICGGAPVGGPVDGVAMVFQTFALFPWLTVLQNVEAGLEAQGVPQQEMRQRALAAIDLIGLDGFRAPSARTLRRHAAAGRISRALVVNPKIVLMDEPFSALDVLTAETLKTDFLDLWTEGKLSIQAVLLVTHNIEEAVFLCDRILVFASDPGRVASELKVSFPHPRDRLNPAFRQMVDDIYATMTAKPASNLPGQESSMESVSATISRPYPPICSPE